MSDFDSDEDLFSSSLFPGGAVAAPRKSARIAALSSSHPARSSPGSSQLSQLTALLPYGDSSPPRPESPPPAVRPGAPDDPRGSDPTLLSVSLLSAVQALHRSVEALTERLPPPAPPERAAPPPALPTSSAFSLDSALPVTQSGRPYTPLYANVSPKLRSKILLGRYINLVSLILPSPEADRRVVSSAELTAVLKSSDPVSPETSPLRIPGPFSTFRDVICSFFPERRAELDCYLTLIGDLHLKYGHSVFYSYHRAFASKAAAAVSQSNVRLDWSVLDTEILIMLTQATPCSLCGAVRHSRSLCPALPFQPEPIPKPGPPPPPVPVDHRGRKIEVFHNTPICNNFNESFCTFLNCLFLHVCSHCKDAHPKSVCPRRLSLTGAGRRGFRRFLVGVSSMPTSTFVAKNLQSALREPEVVSRLLQKEVDKGFVMGPFSTPPFRIFRCSPLGVATRKYSGKKRLILDNSAPHSGDVSSVNSLIPLTPFSLFYASVDHAISLIKFAGRGAWLAKADISDAFKIVPIHPSQWHLFGMKWESKFYFAVRLTFGCRSSPALFNQISEALCLILLHNLRLPFVLHLLNDFLLIDPPSRSPGPSLPKLVRLFRHLGVPLSDEKTVGPATTLEFLGITLDSVAMIASLPQEKLKRIRDVSRSVISAEVFTKQQLLSLLGYLNFAMRIIPQGRSFISRLLDLAHSVPSLFDRVSLDVGCRSDLSFWSRLLSEWNGVSFFYHDVVCSSDSLRFFTDAAPSSGFGGVYQNRWFAEPWPASFPSSEASAFYEIIPIAAACCAWGHLWKRKRIAVLCDNKTVVKIINKGRSSSRSIMPFRRRITWHAVTNNFILTASHVPGHSNVIADALSRFNFQASVSICRAAPDSSAVLGENWS
ncbi:hypothetical protein WMY93_023053 [Mugilogobius chulae]|uniref:ribonuclease H n=1 Tax=Mugilogobius chulae TaxID=88201 RepID=A0AAW0NE91_9GOBI